MTQFKEKKPFKDVHASPSLVDEVAVDGIEQHQRGQFDWPSLGVGEPVIHRERSRAPDAVSTVEHDDAALSFERGESIKSGSL